MRRLQRRVRRMGETHKAAASGAGYAPAGPAMTVSGSAASPSAVSVLPLASVEVYPQPGGTYATIAYRGLAPVYTADGAAVPASAPGRWAQLIAAGRP